MTRKSKACGRGLVAGPRAAAQADGAKVYAKVASASGQLAAPVIQAATMNMPLSSTGASQNRAGRARRIPASHRCSLADNRASTNATKAKRNHI
jgi:hypothetical protein